MINPSRKRKENGICKKPNIAAMARDIGSAGTPFPPVKNDNSGIAALMPMPSRSAPANPSAMSQKRCRR